MSSFLNTGTLYQDAILRFLDFEYIHGLFFIGCECFRFVCGVNCFCHKQLFAVVALRQAPVKLAAAVTPLGFAASARSTDEKAPKKLSTTGAHTHKGLIGQNYPRVSAFKWTYMNPMHRL